MFLEANLKLVEKENQENEANEEKDVVIGQCTERNEKGEKCEVSLEMVLNGQTTDREMQ